MTDPVVPEVFGRYEVIEYIAEGGMGVVLKARDPALDRLLAIKVLSPRDPDDQAAEARFVREAQVAAQLDHPNVAHVYEVGEARGTRYIAMEYVDGPALEGLVEEKGALPPRQALEICAQAARGLAAAAEIHLVHRDVKPGNVLVSLDGKVKVVDFGLARRLMEGASSDLTGSNEILGTPDFIAPEQAQNRPVDHRTDIYSLGATLYFALAGRPPFENEDPLTTILEHIGEPMPDLRTHVPEISDSVCRLVERMCQKDPGQRYQTYEELQQDLTRILEQDDITADPGRPMHKRAPEPVRLAARQRNHVRVLSLLLCLALAALAYQNRDVFYPREETSLLVAGGVGDMEGGRPGQRPPGWQVRGGPAEVLIRRDDTAASGRNYVHVTLGGSDQGPTRVQLVCAMALPSRLAGRTLVLLCKCRGHGKVSLGAGLQEMPARRMLWLGAIDTIHNSWRTINLTHDVGSVQGVEMLELVLEVRGEPGGQLDLDAITLGVAF